MEHVNENKPLKEFAFALIGVSLFVGIVLLIGVSAFLRPAGEHYVAEATEATAEEVEEPTNPTNQPSVPVDTTEVTDPIEVESTPESVEATSLEADTSPAMLPQEGTATAEGTVSQEGAQLVDDNAPAELTDGDVVADTDAVEAETVEVDVVEPDAVVVPAE